MKKILKDKTSIQLNIHRGKERSINYSARQDNKVERLTVPIMPAN